MHRTTVCWALSTSPTAEGSWFKRKENEGEGLIQQSIKICKLTCCFTRVGTGSCGTLGRPASVARPSRPRRRLTRRAGRAGPRHLGRGAGAEWDLATGGRCCRRWPRAAGEGRRLGRGAARLPAGCSQPAAGLSRRDPRAATFLRMAAGWDWGWSSGLSPQYMRSTRAHFLPVMPMLSSQAWLRSSATLRC